MTRTAVVSTLSAIVLVWVAGCGRSDFESDGIVCGAGTEQVGRECIATVPDLSQVCGEGTIPNANGTCVSAVELVVCGIGTVLQGGVCVRTGASSSVLTCGPGTAQLDDQCVGSLSCGPGTVLEDTLCVATAIDGTLLCGPGTVAIGGFCEVDGDAVCGPGTALQGDICISTREGVTCGPGTALQEDVCVGADGGVTCGPGTSLEGDTCVANLLECGPGTEILGDRCISALSCGPGTQRTGDLCEPLPGLRCGPGTIQVVDVCLVDEIPDANPDEVVFEGSVLIENRADVNAILDVNRITGRLNVNGTGLEGLSLPNLREVEFGIIIFSPTLRTVRLPALTRTESLSVGGNQIEVVELSSLVEVENDLLLQALGQVTTLALPALERTNTSDPGAAQAGLLLTGNPELLQVALPRLESVTGLNINSNPSLSIFDAPNLREARRRFTFQANPWFPTCEAEALLEQLDVSPDPELGPFAVFIDGNDSQASCE
ncbi:MAG: hypothetical protein AAFS10_00425 [Myxococcota bacterium]